MSGNTFGSIFRLTTFGESHGPGLGGVVDGCPAGIPLTEAMLQAELDLRRPGQGLGATARHEPDSVRLLSGVFEGVTTGTSIGFYVENQDQRSRDYSAIQDILRPGHADFTYQAKFGVRDFRGGGRASGRETLCRVAGGGVAQEMLRSQGIVVLAYTVEYGSIPARILDPEGSPGRAFFAPDPEVVPLWEARLAEVRGQGDSLGGVVEVRALGVPPGLGEPVFDKLDARIAAALMSVGAVKAVEIGAGCAAARRLGSQNNDPITPEGFASNHAGGILGGISSGQDIVARAFVKPIPSIAHPQPTITTDGRPVSLSVSGRHDVAAIPRIVPVLKAMLALTLADMLLLDRRLGMRDSGDPGTF